MRALLTTAALLFAPIEAAAETYRLAVVGEDESSVSSVEASLSSVPGVVLVDRNSLGLAGAELRLGDLSSGSKLSAVFDGVDYFLVVHGGPSDLRLRIVDRLGSVISISLPKTSVQDIVAQIERDRHRGGTHVAVFAKDEALAELASSTESELFDFGAVIVERAFLRPVLEEISYAEGGMTRSLPGQRLEGAEVLLSLEQSEPPAETIRISMIAAASGVLVGAKEILPNEVGSASQELLQHFDVIGDHLQDADSETEATRTFYQAISNRLAGRLFDATEQLWAADQLQSSPLTREWIASLYKAVGFEELADAVVKCAEGGKNLVFDSRAIGFDGEVDEAVALSTKAPVPVIRLEDLTGVIREQNIRAAAGQPGLRFGRPGLLVVPSGGSYAVAAVDTPGSMWMTKRAEFSPRSAAQPGSPSKSIPLCKNCEMYSALDEAREHPGRVALIGKFQVRGSPQPIRDCLSISFVRWMARKNPPELRGWLTLLAAERARSLPEAASKLDVTPEAILASIPKDHPAASIARFNAGLPAEQLLGPSLGGVSIPEKVRTLIAAGPRAGARIGIALSLPSDQSLATLKLYVDEAPKLSPADVWAATPAALPNPAVLSNAPNLEAQMQILEPFLAGFRATWPSFARTSPDAELALIFALGLEGRGEHAEARKILSDLTEWKRNDGALPDEEIAANAALQLALLEQKDRNLPDAVQHAELALKLSTGKTYHVLTHSRAWTSQETLDRHALGLLADLRKGAQQ